MEINCQLCGRLIELKGNRQKYCTECAVKARRKRDRERYAIETKGTVHRRSRPITYGRFSGLEYENPPEKIDEIREKYRNGVTLQMIEDMVNRLV